MQVLRGLLHTDAFGTNDDNAAYSTLHKKYHKNRPHWEWGHLGCCFVWPCEAYLKCQFSLKARQHVSTHMLLVTRGLDGRHCLVVGEHSGRSQHRLDSLGAISLDLIDERLYSFLSKVLFYNPRSRSGEVG